MKTVVLEEKWLHKHLFISKELPYQYNILYLLKDFCTKFDERCRLEVKMFASPGMLNYYLAVYYDTPKINAFNFQYALFNLIIGTSSKFIFVVNTQWQLLSIWYMKKFMMH